MDIFLIIFLIFINIGLSSCDWCYNYVYGGSYCSGYCTGYYGSEYCVYYYYYYYGGVGSLSIGALVGIIFGSIVVLLIVISLIVIVCASCTKSAGTRGRIIHPVNNNGGVAVIHTNTNVTETRFYNSSQLGAPYQYSPMGNGAAYPQSLVVPPAPPSYSSVTDQPQPPSYSSLGNYAQESGQEAVHNANLSPSTSNGIAQETPPQAANMRTINLERTK